MIKSLKNKSGQAAIEFLIVVVVVFFFLLFYLSLCMGMVLSEYVEYATFMAARTYRSAYKDPAIQAENANIVFNNHLFFGGDLNNPKLPTTLLKINASQTVNDGFRVDYTIPLFYLPPFFIPNLSGASTLGLTAESHQGREPTLEEVQNTLKTISNDLKLGSSGLYQEMDDNGF